MNTIRYSAMNRIKQTMICSILLLFSQTLSAQKKTINEFTAIDKKALQLPNSQASTTTKISDYIKTNFSTDKEKSRAIFIWIATNIQYDIENMFAINPQEKYEDKIAKPLKTRKGICENYAALFNDICAKSGIKSYVIEGYTKQNGVINNLPHAWCAALIEEDWYLFDPTWGSGYVNGGKYYKKINNVYYMAKPSGFIESHIPFDYLWQFLNYPITSKEFQEGKTEINKSKPYFNYVDSIRIYESQNHIDQLISSASRIEKNGVKNILTYNMLQYLKVEIKNDRQNKIVSLYNAASADYNDGINKFNEFIDFRNKQFTPQRADSDIQLLIDDADNKLKEARAKLAQIKPTDANTTNMVIQFTKSIDDVTTHIIEQQEWLKVYFSKGKLKRKMMLMSKVSWFGIPLN